MRWATLALLLTACSGDDKGDSGEVTPTDTDGETTPTGGATDCSPSEADDLPDPTAGLGAQADACAVSPYWSTANLATTFFVGDFEIDDCGAVTGREIWVLYMNPNMEDLGYTDCEVIWDVTGTLDGPLEAGDVTIEMSAIVNAALSTCKANEDGVEIYVGEEDVTLEYTVILSEDGTADVRFSGSGDTLGLGAWNLNNLTYTSDVSCKAF
jgi:hypothetical protein